MKELDRVIFFLVFVLFVIYKDSFSSKIQIWTDPCFKTKQKQKTEVLLHHLYNGSKPELKSAFKKPNEKVERL